VVEKQREEVYDCDVCEDTGVIVSTFFDNTVTRKCLCALEREANNDVKALQEASIN
jgi:hypothetical protein